MKFLKTIQIIFLLLVFAAPQVANTLHRIAHSHKNTCFETKIHIHEKHNNCEFQDYTFDKCDYTITKFAGFANVSYSSRPILLKLNFFVSILHGNDFTRGPPVV